MAGETGVGSLPVRQTYERNHRPETRCVMRSIWKGHIRFSLVTIPIRIYNAVDTEETIRFNQLHKDDNGAVGYEKKCKKCDKSLTVEEIVNVNKLDPENYVIESIEDNTHVKYNST